MSDLSATYLGLKLANPVILGSSGLTSSAEGVRRAFDAGAGAVVLKSLFEEQLRKELGSVDAGPWSHPEAEAFLSRMGMNEGADEYLRLIDEAKKDGRGPVIASVNCVGEAFWTDFAGRVESAGADALELNLGQVPDNPNEDAAAVESRLERLVRDVRSSVRIPVAVKLGYGYTALGHLIKRLAKADAQGAVLFNRFYKLDVDLDAMSLSSGPARSGPESYHDSLRWIALLDGRVGAELCASGGVHDGATVLKLVAAGAHAVQVCSAAYSKGYGVISSLLDDIRSWMSSRGIASLDELRGRLARRNSEHPELYGRLQYLEALHTR